MTCSEASKSKYLFSGKLLKTSSFF